MRCTYLYILNENKMKNEHKKKNKIMCNPICVKKWKFSDIINKSIYIVVELFLFLIIFFYVVVGKTVFSFNSLLMNLNNKVIINFHLFKF